MLQALDSLAFYRYLALQLIKMNINIPEKYADLYLKALHQKKQMLKAKIEDFTKEIEEIDHHIQALTSLPIFDIPEYSFNRRKAIIQYRSEWSWTRKILLFQEMKQKIFTSSEVVDFITDNEPEVNKSKIRSSISAALSNKHRTGRFRKFTDPATGKTYYGPQDWFMNDGQPYPHHVPEDITLRLLER